MNYILFIILAGLIWLGYVQFYFGKFDPPEVPYERPDFDKWDDLQPMQPLHRYGLHGQGENRRGLQKKQREQYEKIQGWASKFAKEASK